MFNIFKKKKEKEINIQPMIRLDESPDTEENGYNFWLAEEIKLCKKYGYDIEKYITPNTHPLHAKQITKALFDELPKDKILELANIKYENDLQLIEIRKKLELNPKLEYFLDNFKPDVIKENIKIDENRVLKGVILGDIIGSKYEFSDHKPLTQLIHRYAHFTDDTVMSIAVKEAILENEKEPDFAKYYKKFYKKYPRAGYGSSFTGWCIKSDNSAYGSWANGSAMRVSFVGAHYKDIDDVIKYAYKSAAVTHNHFEGIKGAIVTAVCVWMCKNKYSKDEIKDYLFKHYGYTEEQLEIKTYGKMIYNLYEPDKNRFKHEGGVSCMFTVPYAISCFIETNSPEECFFKILEHFCDADTVCAIAGGLIGAFYDLEQKYDKIISNKLPDKLFELLKK